MATEHLSEVSAAGKSDKKHRGSDSRCFDLLPGTFKITGWF